MNPKIILAHAGHQTVFRRAEALKSSGTLYRFITTVYLKKSNIKYMRLLKVFSGNEYSRLLNHNCSALDDQEVIQYYMFRNILMLAINRSSKGLKLYNKMNMKYSKLFAKKAAKFAIRENADMLIMMGAAPRAAFKYLTDNDAKTIKVFDMTSVAYNAQERILLEQKKYLPDSWGKLLNVTPSVSLEMMDNIYTADYVICSSSFAKQTLLDSGYPDERIRVVPYALEKPSIVKPMAREKINNDKLRLLYVGSVSCEKGMYYLLEAVSRLSGSVSLTLVGKNYLPNEITDKYSEFCIFIGDIPHDKVNQYYQDTDVFVTPSLYDSFGRTVTEALENGVPVICSDHVGASDYICNGENGLVVRAGNIDELSDAIQYFINNFASLQRFKENAYETANSHSWEKYYEDYNSVISELIQTERKTRG